jgi:hypothetical protein
LTYVSWPVAGSNPASRTVRVPLSPGLPPDDPGGALVGALDGDGIAFGPGVAPLREGSTEAVDVRGVVGPGMDDRAALEGAVSRAEVTVSLLMVLLVVVGAGTAVPRSTAPQAAVVASRAATPAARPFGG